MCACVGINICIFLHTPLGRVFNLSPFSRVNSNSRVRSSNLPGRRKTMSGGDDCAIIINVCRGKKKKKKTKKSRKKIPLSL